MASERASVFLERRSYRRRRMVDGLRLLPVLGVMLWMLPVFWPVGGAPETQVSTSTAITYIFAIWLLLIALCLTLWLVLRPHLHAEARIEEDA